MNASKPPRTAHRPTGASIAPWTALLAAVAASLATPASATAERIGEIDRIRGEGLYELPFELREAAKVSVRAVGAGPTEDEPLLAYAWILDASTREVAWEMTRENTDEVKRGGEDRVFEGTIDLGEGRYIAYYSAISRLYVNPRGGFRLFRKWLGFQVGGGFLARWDGFGEPRRWGIWLETTDRDGVVRDWDGEIDDDSFLHFAPMGDDASESAAFRVSRPVDVTLRCLAEYFESEGTYADRASLVHALSREVVWETNEADHEPAGGGFKNHAFHVRLRLEPGDYLLGYTTDDSHSYDEWNQPPPYDPQGWGVSLRVDDTRAVSLIRDPREALLLLAIDEVGNGAYERRAFELTHPLSVRIEGLGESDGRRNVDYGWLDRLPEQKTIWSMEYERGQAAGGASKNRLVVDRLDLEPGRYMLSYVTDGSHSFEDWNSAPPDDPSAWGVHIYATSADFDASVVTELDPRQVDPAVISLAPTGDNTHRKQLMTLPRTYELRVICAGEGLDGQMYDYGWIEDAETSTVVWKMTYDDSWNAGGAGKNKIVDTVVSLKPGRYVVHYVTDGSHSFDDWNASPPEKPQLWGITIYPAGKGPLLDPGWN